MRFMDEKWVAGLLVLGIAAPAPCFADSVGHVIRLNPIVSVLREGKTIPLGVKDQIYLNDVIQTDKSGKVQVFFKDDSTVTLGNNTKAHMKEFVPDGNKASFDMNVAQGVARVITGKIVEKNPNGFAITTPEATVGIRGTILVVNTASGKTTVFVENTAKEVFVNNTLVPSGFKLTLPADSHSPIPITEGDKRGIEEASTVASTNNNVISTQDSIITVGTDNLGDIPLEIQSIGDSDSLTLNVVPTTGTVAGTLQFGYMGSGSGSFSFDVGLTTGAVSNAEMSGSASMSTAGSNIQSFNVSGGSGNMQDIKNFSGTYTTFGNSTPTSVGSGTSLNTSHAPGSVPALGESVGGSFYIMDSTNSVIVPYADGAITGERIK